MVTASDSAPHMREMVAADIPATIPLLAQLSGVTMTTSEVQSRLDFVATSPFDWLYVCTVADQVCGVLALRLRELLERVGRTMEVYLIVTGEHARRRGVGRAMMDFAERSAREHDCNGLFLVSGFKRKDEAHRFYEQLGYTATGYRFVKMLDR